MGGLFAQLLPVALVGAVAPLPILIAVTLLMSKGGLAKAVAFSAALVGVFAVIGAVSLATSPGSASGTEKGSVVTGTIIAVLGALFVVIALKQWLHAPDPDAPPPKFMTALDTMSATRAAVFGVILGLTNFKQLGIFVGGVAQVVAADISSAQRWVAMAVFLVVMQVGVIVPIGYYAVDRDRATRGLSRVREWLVEHNRVLGIMLGLVIGAWFTIKGISQIA